MPPISTLLSLATLTGLAISLPSASPSVLHPRAAFRCPIRDVLQTKCLGPKDCLYPNPDDCASYIRCELDEGERSATPHVEHCPLGTKWNDRKKECDLLV